MNKSRGERGAQMKRRKFARRLWTVLLLAGLCALLGLSFRLLLRTEMSAVSMVAGDETARVTKKTESEA